MQNGSVKSHKKERQAGSQITIYIVQGHIQSRNEVRYGAKCFTNSPQISYTQAEQNHAKLGH